MEDLLQKLPQALLGWFSENKRDLPWRADREPYHIWVSEIMLQQTRVEAVKGYYSRFLAALPTVEALANAEDDHLRKLWEGLGYYNRVRNMKKAAEVICGELGGAFPQTLEGLLRLPGVGSYTAGAIGSIAFELPAPAVDGNVLRVVSRLCADETPIDLPTYKKRVEAALQKVYPAGRCGDFTQSLMELGATVCLPNGKPKCAGCPCKTFCLGLQQGEPERLPIRLPKKSRRLEEKTVFVLSCDGCYAVQKREKTGLLASLWEFPNVPGRLELAEAINWAQPLSPAAPTGMVERQHIFTHVQWNMRCYYLSCREKSAQFTWVTPTQIAQEIALPTAFKMFWDILQAKENKV